MNILSVCVGVGVDIYVHGHKAGIFILIGSILVLFFEVKWVITVFVQLLFASENYSSSCILCWSICRIAGAWRLSPFYIAYGTALIFWPHNLWLSYVAGVFLIILAILRLCTIFKFSGNFKGDEGLLPQRDDFMDKSEAGVTEGIDDSFPDICHTLEDEEPVDEET
ncbi:uncharacterized protein LOC129606866 isoform X2 [Condylostylus longicornis]|uniref:uncharacterized protein LOC129606866 isoform X2 n=1 Tax=Condylostylus longicornis TaxID=2530218 RepID=UPI00244DAA75|nr:uncharacterized protein LOC129606866 isoform X2 [Condylostylus longicornis]